MPCAAIAAEQLHRLVHCRAGNDTVRPVVDQPYALTSREALHTQLEAGVESLGLDLPAGVLQRQLDYLELLAKWNAHYNLTAVRDPQAMVTLHLLDSLAALPYLQGDTVADIGSGAGLPGIPLALASPGRHFTLVDSNGKKVRFLRAAVRELGLANVTPVQSRAEELEGRFDCLTTRALANLADMLAWCGHLLAPSGRLLALKGRYPEDELAHLDAPFRLAKALPLTIPGLEAERHLLIIDRGERQAI